MIIQEGKLNFHFDIDINAIKFDDTIYYRKHFEKIKIYSYTKNSLNKVKNGIKAIDILVVNKKQNFMIEVKDYTNPKTKQLTEEKLIDDITKKVFDSLGAIYPMSYKSTDENEKDIANEFLKNRELFIIFHIEKPPPRRTLKQSSFNNSDIQTKLRDRLKPITSKSNIKVVSKDNLQNLPWSVTIATP